MTGIDFKPNSGKKPYRAFIFTGGCGFCPDRITDFPDDEDIIIAADSGCSAVVEFSEKVANIEPDIILGDMDSYLGESIESCFPKSQFLAFPPEKDDTDTALAVSVALELGCRRIVIAGGLGGRLDHTLANVYLLEYIRSMGAECVITDGKNRAYLAAERNVFDSDNGRKYVSLIPLDNAVYGVHMDKNFRYPFDADKIDRARFVTVSNEILSYPAEIRVHRGSALIVETGD